MMGVPLKVVIIVLLAGVTRVLCKDQCFVKFNCEWDSARPGQAMKIVKTETRHLCAHKCCSTEGCMGYDWSLNGQNCSLSKTLRNENPMTEKEEFWSCEKKPHVRVKEAKANERTIDFTLIFVNSHSREVCLSYKDRNGKELKLDRIKPKGDTIAKYINKPVIVHDCLTRRLLRFTDGNKTSVIADGSTFGTTKSGEKRTLTIVDPLNLFACQVNPDVREYCGYPGITKSTCEQRGCCYNEKWAGTISCFHTILPKDLCMVNPEVRKDCGTKGMTKKQCTDAGCCYNDQTPKAKKCFLSQINL